MTVELMSAVVCSPGNAVWNDSAKTGEWRRLGFLHTPNFDLAQAQHDNLCHILHESGAEVITLPADDSATLDAVYVHDASLPTDHGIILMNPGKNNRRAEAEIQAGFYAQAGIPISGSVESPGTSEAGDIVWLDSNTLLVGHGYRTNATGIAQMRSL